MNWEKSKVLSPLKKEFLEAFFERETRFFLTGGTALGVFYLQHRISYDLDLFSVNDFDWHDVDAALRDACREINADVEIIKSARYFRRYRLTRNSESELVDIVRDFNPQVDESKSSYGKINVDTIHEILLNKICTLISRCEIKDLIDLYFLDKNGFRVEDYVEEAKVKDGGLDPAMISYILARVKIDELPDYLVQNVSRKEFCDYVEHLRIYLASLAFPDSD